MKNTFVVTITNGYMFSLNATINAMKYFGTDADFHILYQWETPKEYIDSYKKAFPNTFWIPIANWGNDRKYTDAYHSFFADKYIYSLKIKDDYDSICIIDGDLFICTNVNEYFRLASEEKKFITATHEHCALSADDFYKQDLSGITNRCRCAFADFPTFINTKIHQKFLLDWYEQTFMPISGTEINHPLISMNRSIYKNIPKESVITLDGNSWVCDKNYWELDYIKKDNNIYNNLGIVGAIHNRWWKEGRVNNELNTNINISLDNKLQIDCLDRAQNNFNTIVSCMEWFNNMTPETKVTNYNSIPHNWRKYLGRPDNFGK